MPKIAVVGIPGGWSSDKLADTVAEMTGFRLLVNMYEVYLDFDKNQVIFKGHDLTQMDALIIKKIGSRYSPDLLDRLDVLRFLEGKGVKIISKPSSIMSVLNRLSCTVTLQLGNIPMPPTTITESVEEALQAVENYKEAVFKPLFTSKARGMTLIKSGSEARQQIEAYKQDNQFMYIQKKIALPEQDLGITFLGGKYLTTYARQKTNGSWNTTTREGGQYGYYQPSEEIKKLAHKAQSLFDLDFTCVDVVETEEGPLVFEVSAFGGFRGIYESCGLDAAKLLVEYTLKQIGEKVL